ncbi:CoA transferase subunit A [Geothrix sp. PMB-07]|uniref:CoA transferase subunit A n=1 Tax=Geothrix sp. PMB-07 TaxID=3068640 RepID=UPI002740FB5D|nr:CoA transferase subunit A [Geothrix sp. PMB-07]WLT31141.1 CoA transferase subunit A [Geothrix sp. PMB-07]
MIQKPVISAADAAAKVRDGDVLMVGGFMACGSPHTVIEALTEKGAKNLTLICNDTGIHDFKSGKVTGVGHLVVKRQFKKIIASHIGLNQETQRQINDGETEVSLVPQGTLAERVRAGGVGLGGILTPTGLGTEVEQGKQVITVGDRLFLLELPLKADVALIKAKKADRFGNLVYADTARNFNPMMAMAASLVIAEAEEIVEVGDIDPNAVHTPGIFIDFLVQAERLDG